MNAPNDMLRMNMNLSSKVWIVVPAYNEATILGTILSCLCSFHYQIVVIDDCSTDSTSEIAMKFPVVLLRHNINLGQGAALQTGFDYITTYTDARCIVTFDSDGQHDVNEIPALIAPILSGAYDVALGSRFLDRTSQQSRSNGMPLFKLFTLKTGILFTVISTKIKVTDTHNGFRAFSFGALKKIDLKQNRMAHGSELLNQIAKSKLRYCEVPVNITYTDYSKKKGQSVFNSINILWDLIFGSDK